MALLGEPLDAMVQNLGQANNGYVSANATNKVVSQGFTTGLAPRGYRLQGIGVNIEGSGSNYPDGPTSVSVAVHANSNGQPGAKLVDLVSPTENAAGHSFFEAPPGTYLRGSTSYVLVWRHLGGTVHRLRKTASNGEDAGALVAFSIANAFYRGAAVGSLSEHSGGDALEIAVYGESNTKTVVYISPPPPPPPPPPFIPSVSGGGGAILRCSVPPSASCPTYDDVSPPRTVLSATLTVGKIGADFIQRIGYGATTEEITYGTISNNTVSLSGRSYTIGWPQDRIPHNHEQAYPRVQQSPRRHRQQSHPTPWIHLPPLKQRHPFRLRLRLYLDQQPRHHLVRRRIRLGEDHRGCNPERLRLQDHLDGADDGGGFPTFYCFRIQPY